MKNYYGRPMGSSSGSERHNNYAERRYPSQSTTYDMTSDNFEGLRSTLPHSPTGAYHDEQYRELVASNRAWTTTPVTYASSSCTVRNGERVIIVLGPTGVGKSRLIQDLSGHEDIIVGHGVNSETSRIESWPMKYNGVAYALIDTPGFDDSYRSNQEIVEEILQWLAEAYRSDFELAAVVYVHSIMNPRMQGSALQNLRMFQKLVGEDGMRNVILATSFWGEVDPVKGQERELALITSSEFFGSLIGRGATYVRLEDDPAERLDLFDHIVYFDPVILQCQQEMVEQDMSSEQTAAARITTRDAAASKAEKKRHEEEMRIIRQRAERQDAQQKRTRELEKQSFEAELARQRQLDEQRTLLEKKIDDADVERRQQEREAKASEVRQVQQLQIEQKKLYNQKMEELQAQKQRKMMPVADYDAAQKERSAGAKYRANIQETFRDLQRSEAFFHKEREGMGTIPWMSAKSMFRLRDGDIEWEAEDNYWIPYEERDEDRFGIPAIIKERWRRMAAAGAPQSKGAARRALKHQQQRSRLSKADDRNFEHEYDLKYTRHRTSRGYYRHNGSYVQKWTGYDVHIKVD